MKLYFSKGACSMAVRIIINELDLSCEFISVDLKTKKTQDNKDFYEINPKGAVPVIETEDHKILTENAVILQYLADHYKAPQLLPPIGDFKRYRVLEWVNYIATELHKSFGPLFNPKFPEALKDSYVKPLIIEKLKYPNRALENHTYLLGDQFTLPDAYFFVIFSWMSHFKMEVSQFENLTRYYKTLKQKPSIVKSLKQEFNH